MGKTYSLDQLKKQSVGTFAANPDAQKLIATADGMFFLPSKQNAAKYHSNQNGKLEMYEITRTAEINKAVGKLISEQKDIEESAAAKEAEEKAAKEKAESEASAKQAEELKAAEEKAAKEKKEADEAEATAKAASEKANKEKGEADEAGKAADEAKAKASKTGKAKDKDK